MKIKVEVTLLVDNEIRFFDACKAVADVLTVLGKQALEDGEVPNPGKYEVLEPLDDEVIGYVRVVA